ncbi:MAG: RNA 2',3'-cyclic phosphodiesterase [Synergistaceae bacterium]|jgi:2'-5' RNA ligase|nr:RNA 2',3'-cyclic phosphodiesterase [Synergistaceae bacterium]
MRINEESIRAFICVCPAAGALSEIAFFLKGLGGFSGFKWATPEQIHITLRFLGDAAPSFVTRMDSALSGLGGVRRFRISLAGAGAFPSLARPKALWLGVSEGAPQLAKLASKTEQAAKNSGFPPDARGFTPHLTIGRARQGSAMTDALALALKKAPSPSWECASFVLMRSVLSPSGAVYTPIREYPL